MIRVLVLSLVTLSAVAAWNISVFFATSEGWLKSPIVKSDSAQAFARPPQKRRSPTEHTGNLSIDLNRKAVRSPNATSCLRGSTCRWIFRIPGRVARKMDHRLG